MLPNVKVGIAGVDPDLKLRLLGVMMPVRQEQKVGFILYPSG